MQQVFPYYHSGGAAPVKVAIGVGDEPRPRLRIVHQSSSPFGIDGAIYGWWGRETDGPTLAKGIGNGTAQGDSEIMATSTAPGPWYDVPADTAFILLHTTAAGRGHVILETGPRQA